jgi:3-hydroxymyristoyl/3-hydroxydecanoyl-(acyl carrier protein) dehydratase
VSERYEGSFTIAAEHPSLPGHFPGSPVVPGVVVLDNVMAQFDAWRGDGARVVGVRQVKFHAPLLPGERADVLLERDGVALTFRVSRAGQPVAQGTMTLSSGKPA